MKAARAGCSTAAAQLPPVDLPLPRPPCLGRRIVFAGFFPFSSEVPRSKPSPPATTRKRSISRENVPTRPPPQPLRGCPVPSGSPRDRRCRLRVGECRGRGRGGASASAHAGRAARGAAAAAPCFLPKALLPLLITAPPPTLTLCTPQVPRKLLQDSGSGALASPAGQHFGPSTAASS